MTSARLPHGLFPFLFLVLAAPVAAAPDDAKQITWVKSFDQALELAKQRLAPVFVALHDDDSELDYRDSGLVKISRKFVCLIASLDRHRERGGKTKTCTRFGCVSCDDHIRVAAAAARSFYLESGNGSRGHLILTPDGKVIDRQWLELTSAGLTRFLENGLAGYQKEAARVIARSLRARKAAARERAFEDAVYLLTENSGLKTLRTAASKYLSRTKRGEDRRRAWDTVAVAGSEGALSLLAPFLKEKSPTLRLEALAVFARCEPAAAFIDDFAARVRVEKSEAALHQLVSVLDKYADRYPEALRLLDKLVAHKSPSVKVLATLAAARPDNTVAGAELLKRARNGGHNTVRRAAVLGLARMNAREVLPTLRKLLARKGGKSDFGRTLDLAVAKLSGHAGVEKAFREACDALANEVRRSTEEDSDRGNDRRRDRTDRRWAPGTGR